MISKILASVGLPDTPEGRKLFYHTFPSKELYEMAMGGVLPTAQTGKTTGSEGVYNAAKKPFVAPKVANKVAAPGEGFVLMEGQDPEAIKTYYDKKLKEADPGKPGLPSETPPADKKKYKEWVIGLAKQGYKPEEIIGKKYASPDMLGILTENYQAQYTEKEKPIIKEKAMDLGIGWAGERKEIWRQGVTPVKDAAGNSFNPQTFTIPAVWDPKTKSWDTSGAWNQGTTIHGYYDQNKGKFIHFNESASKYATKGEGQKTESWYPAETLVPPEYGQQEAEKVMKTGPLTVTGATGVDVTNSGMGYNPEKDVVEPLNTRGGGRGIGKSKLVKDVGVENLPAGTGYLNTGQPLIQNKEGGLTYPMLPNFINPEYIMACGGMHKMQPGGNHSMGFIGGFEGTKNKPVLTNAQVEEIARTNEPGYANKYDQMRIDAFKEYAKTHPKESMLDKITSAPGKAWDWLNVDMPAYILSAGARAGEKAGLEANSELFPDYTKTMNDTTMKGLTPAQQQLKKIGQSKKEGGPTYPGQTQQSKGNEITDQFLNYIKNNTMKAIANEESNNMQQEMMNSFMQNGGNNVYGYNPNMNNQNAFINAANNTRQKTQQDFGNFFSATQNLNDTANPYMETEITQTAMYGGIPKAQFGVMTNPSTGKPYSPEEYAALQAHFGNKTESKNEPDKHGEKWYNQGAGTHGMNYMPMNYNPFVKFSDETKKNYQELVNNPTSNLKSFKSRHFGPFGKTVMEFGYKDKMQPFIANPTPAQPINNVPVNSNPNQFTKPEEQETLRQAKGYDPIKAQFGYNFLGSSQTETNNAMSGKPAVDPMYTTVAQGKTDADIAREKAGLPPESLTSDPLTNYGGPEKTKKLTQKYRPGFDNEASANWIMAGMNGVASMFENADARKNEEKWKSLQGADNQFYAMQAGNKGGTDQFGRIVGNGTPTQFKGQNSGQIGSPYTAAGKYGGSYQEGGEYYMTDDEIMAIVRSGGQIEFLD